MTSTLRKSVPATVVTPVAVDPYITHIDDRERFRMLLAGLLTAAAVSTNYCFNLITDFMKDRYNYGQKDITNIVTVGNCAAAFTFPSGVIFDYYGASVAVAFPCLIGTIGFFFVGLTFSDYIKGSVPLFSVFSAIFCLGTSSMDTGSLMTNILNFPRDRGAVVILQKTFTGLGASILAVWFGSFFPGRYDVFVYFTAGMVFVFGMTGAAFLRLPPYHVTTLQRRRLTEDELISREVTRDIYMTQRPSPRRLAVGYVVLSVLIVFLTTQSIVVAYMPVSHTTRVLLGSMVTAIMASFVVVALPVRVLDAPEEAPLLLAGAEAVSPIGRAPPSLETLQRVPVPSDVNTEDCVYEGAAEDFMAEAIPPRSGSQRRSYAATLPGPALERLPEAQFNDPFFRNLLTINLWLLFWTSFCNFGSGNVMISNAPQIYRALNNNEYVASTNTLYVTLIGVGSALGRVLMGCIEMTVDKYSYPSNRVEELLVSPLSLHGGKRRLHVIMFYPLSSIILVVALVFLLLLPVSLVAVPLVLVGFASGYSWACTALVVRSLFAKDVGKHYGFLFLGSFFANISLNRFMFGELFDAEGEKMNLYPFCAGLVCVAKSFYIMLGLNASALITSVLICWRFLRYASGLDAQSRLYYHQDAENYDVQ